VKTAMCCNPAPQLVPAIPSYYASNTKPILCTGDTDNYIALYADKTNCYNKPAITVSHTTAKGVKKLNYGTNIPDLSESFDPDVWSHFALVKTGATITCYINAELAITASYAPFEGVGSWTIGKDWLDSFGKFYIDEFYLWKGVALSEAQIAALYNNGTGKFLT
jgi:hypothetical protein